MKELSALNENVKQFHQNIDKDIVLIAAGFLMMAPALSAQNPQNGITKAKKKALTEDMRFHGGINATAQGEATYSGNINQLAQAFASFSGVAENDKVFAEVKGCGMVYNDTDDKSFETACAEFIVRGGLKFNNGRLIMSIGKKPLMGEDNSGAFMEKTIRTSNDDIMKRNVTATADNSLNLEWEAESGDKFGLGIIETTPNGTIFHFGNDNSVYLFARKMMFDKRLRIAGNLQLNKENHPVGYAAVRYAHDKDWSIMAEGTQLGTADQSAILSFNKKMKQTVLAVNSYLQDGKEGTSVSVHYKDGYLGVGYDKAKGQKGTFSIAAGFSLSKAFAK